MCVLTSFLSSNHNLSLVSLSSDIDSNLSSSLTDREDTNPPIFVTNLRIWKVEVGSLKPNINQVRMYARIFGEESIFFLSRDIVSRNWLAVSGFSVVIQLDSMKLNSDAHPQRTSDWLLIRSESNLLKGGVLSYNRSDLVLNGTVLGSILEPNINVEELRKLHSNYLGNNLFSITRSRRQSTFWVGLYRIFKHRTIPLLLCGLCIGCFLFILCCRNFKPIGKTIDYFNFLRSANLK